MKFPSNAEATCIVALEFIEASFKEKEILINLPDHYKSLIH
jgi:hypothetical protein